MVLYWERIKLYFSRHCIQEPNFFLIYEEKKNTYSLDHFILNFSQKCTSWYNSKYIKLFSFNNFIDLDMSSISVVFE